MHFRIIWSLVLALNDAFSKVHHQNGSSIFFKYYFASRNTHIMSFFLSISEDSLSTFLFYYLPICIIFTANILLSILTAIKIYRAKHDVDTLLMGFNRNQANLETIRNNFALYLRLFFVTGITWSADAIAFISPDSICFYLTDICNSLHGVFIFILFVMKPSVLRLIKKRFFRIFRLILILRNWKLSS